MLIKDGQKISKSKGNGIPLVRVKEKYGADLYRLYIAVGANYDIEMDFKDEEIEQLEKKFEKWKSIISESIKLPCPEYTELSGTSKWLVSKFYSYVKEYFTMFDSIRMREAYVGVLYEFLNDIAYHERRTSIKDTHKAIRFIAKDYITIMTPAVPHICEEYYSLIRNEDDVEFVSLAKFNSDYEKYTDKQAEDIENIIQELVSTISRVKGSKNIAKLQSVKVVQANSNKFKLFDAIRTLLGETKDVKTIFGKLKEDFSSDFKFIQKFVPKTLGSGLDHYLPKEEEKEYLTSVIPFLEKEFDCRVEIISTDEQAGSAIPGKPGVVLE
jgi:leucyl-tRNA synthetase